MKTCPDCFDPDITQALERVGNLWHESTVRPVISEDILQAWDSFLLEWLKDKKLPLIIRSSKNCPGSEVFHPGGRTLIPSDNSPASWAFTLAERGEVPTISNLERYLLEDKIPFALAIKATHKSSTKYFCNLAKICDNPNARGWKVAHIISVGIRKRGELSQQSLEDLASHFIKLLSPRNMYAVPKDWAGMAEITLINQVFKNSSGEALQKLLEEVRLVMP